MATASQFIAQAAKYIGVSGDYNIFNKWYWCDLNGYSYDPGTAWCACFQSYVGVHDLGMDFSPSASAAGVANQGTRVADEDARPGDWVLFNWDGRQSWGWADHIGVVEWSDISGSGYFGTIEGNCDGTVKRCTRYNYSSYATAFFRPNYSGATPKPAVKSRLTAIDIASHQEGIIPSKTKADIVIVKATGGTSYVNGYPSEDADNWRIWAKDVLASGKELALYHYAHERGCQGTAAQEARHFLDTVKEFKGKFVPILDWEADALSLPQSWAREWLDIVAEETGSVPMFYGYASNLNSSDYSYVAEKYPLWMASYLSKYAGSDLITNPENIWGTGDWDDMLMYQYTSQGDIDGWNGNIDLSVFYGGVKDWSALVGGDYSGGGSKMGGWKKGSGKNKDKWWYEHYDGSWTADDWEWIDGKWYYFDAEGWMLTGWKAWNGQWYYLCPDGHMSIGWDNIDWHGKHWFWFDGSGAMISDCFKKIDGKWYGFDSNGVMVDELSDMSVSEDGDITIKQVKATA